MLLFLYVQGDNGDEDLAPTEVDGQFEFQAKDNVPPGGFKFCWEVIVNLVIEIFPRERSRESSRLGCVRADMRACERACENTRESASEKTRESASEQTNHNRERSVSK